MQGFQPGKHKASKAHKVMNYANGGIVRGPGTGTSDDVEAMVPEDGYIMPADSTKALGFKPGMRKVNVSDGEAVMTPEQVQAAGGTQVLDQMRAATHTPVPEQGGEPQFFFANGGAVNEDERLTERAVRQQQLQQSQAATAVRQAETAQRYEQTGAQMAAEARAAAASRQRDATIRPYRPEVTGPNAGAGRGFVNPAGVQADPVTGSPTATPTPAAASPAVTPPMAAPGAAPAAGFAPGNVNVRRQANGVMEFSGQNVAGDVSYTGAGAAGFKPSGAGVSVVPSAPAAGAAPMVADPVTGGQPAQGPTAYIPKDTGGYGLLDKDRIAIRNASIDVKQGDPGAAAVLNSLLGQQAAAPGQQLERDQMEAETQIKTADLAQRGAEAQSARGFRAGQLQNEAARTALEGKKVASDLEVRGFEVGQAKRLEALRQKYEATTDPKAKAELAQQLRTLSGKDDQQNRFTVVPGGQEWNQAAGVMQNVPARVLNNQTGQFVDGAGAQKALPPLKDNQAAMAIVNDTSMTPQQRAERLRAMGYN